MFSGAYVIYPWYRAVPPEGLADLSEYPRRLLLSSGKTSEWHNIGMEWKEHIAWLSPIFAMAVASITLRYGPRLQDVGETHQMLRFLLLLAFVSGLVAGGGWGPGQHSGGHERPQAHRRPHKSCARHAALLPQLPVAQ